MHKILYAHQGIGLILVIVALAAIFWAPARRYVLYVLVLQIVLGCAVWGITKLVPPPAHYILAILTGGIYAIATAFERKGRPRNVVVAMLAVAFVVIAAVYSIGQHAFATATG